MCHYLRSSVLVRVWFASFAYHSISSWTFLQCLQQLKHCNLTPSLCLPILGLGFGAPEFFLCRRFVFCIADECFFLVSYSPRHDTHHKTILDSSPNSLRAIPQTQVHFLASQECVISTNQRGNEKKKKAFTFGVSFVRALCWSNSPWLHICCHGAHVFYFLLRIIKFVFGGGPHQQEFSLKNYTMSLGH